ncbi:calmodulin-binding receptor kinase CaMRLK [Aristolochia californica]|uniref:calmodulin-binding receptor kinase CaMRLK n=1 Tax=Aristolochia californica TaxID=171875 RepID=UPI0035DAF7CE
MEMGDLCRPVFFLCLLALAESSSSLISDWELVSRAFGSVTGFDSSLISDGKEENFSVKEIKLPANNLSGVVSWMFLTNLTKLETVDLSMNSLQGSVPGRFWSMPSLINVNLAMNRLGGSVRLEHGSGLSNSSSVIRMLNLSTNRYTNSFNLLGFTNLKVLDLSHNDLRSLPSGLENLNHLQHLDLSCCNISASSKPIANLRSLEYLDLSNNAMRGSFPSEFPPLVRMKFLNISANKFTGLVESEKLKRFGSSAFASTGIYDSLKTHKLNHTLRSPPSGSPSHIKHKTFPTSGKRRKQRKVVVVASVSSVTCLAAVVVLLAYLYRRRRVQRRKKWAISKPQLPLGKLTSGPFSFETESRTWVADIKEPSSAPVVMFEKPLMKLTFSDLMVATSGFGRESQLAEGRSGPLYRAVLPGDIHVVIKVLEKAKDLETEEAVGMFEELARIKHLNLLPPSGYCIAGKEKLLLYEFMANGDLNQWLHELPTGHTNVEDWSTDTWETQTGAAEKIGWPTRHRIALGIARGLAFLHHAGSKSIVHGHVVPTNILLDEDLEPRIVDFGLPGGDAGNAGTASDVYSFGVVLLELLTGQTGSEEMVTRVRRLVKEKLGTRVIDPRMRLEEDVPTTLAEALRVGYLCTAEPPEKRPTMQQVVGMLKDIHIRL